MNQPQDKINNLVKELKKTESWLALSEERVRTLIKVIPAGLLITDASGNIEATNSESQNIFACTREQLVGRNVRELLQPDTKHKHLFEQECLMELTEPIELTAKSVNGKIIPAEIQIREFSNFENLQFLVVIEDITRRFEIERLKEDFIAMVTHDLRAPLTSISTFHELIAAGTFDGDSSTLKKKIKGIQQEMTRLIGMVSGLLDLEKLESGKLDMLIAPVNCRTLIQRSLGAIEALADSKRIQIQTEFPNSEIEVLADSDYILQVLVNLLSNALKFSPVESTIRISVKEDQVGTVKILVADQGPGIKEEFKHRIFSRYEQAHISDARVKGGSGLGLAISKKIIEQHGGTIGVNSTEGSGSVFWFTLPKSNSSTSKKYDLSLPPNVARRKVYIDELIETALESVEKSSEPMGVTLEAGGTESVVYGDRELLLRALETILLVAVKSAHQGSAIQLNPQDSDKFVEIVIDQRSDSSSKQSYEANASFENDHHEEIIYCKKIIEMHNGSMNIKQLSPGQLVISFKLPVIEI